MRPITGMIIYRGPSLLDGAPIVAIATGLDGKHRNSKTGNMVQTWIMRDDIAPISRLRLAMTCHYAEIASTVLLMAALATCAYSKHRLSFGKLCIAAFMLWQKALTLFAMLAAIVSFA